MPIYEFKCKKCEHRFEAMRLSSDGFKGLQCPKCKSVRLEKQMSTFAPAMGTGASPAACDTGSCPAPSFDGCSSGMCGLN